MERRQRSWAYRTERQRFRRVRRRRCRRRPAPRRSAIGRSPARSADWARRTCEPTRAATWPPARGERLISLGLPLAAPLELRTPTSERARLPRPEHELRYDHSGASFFVWTVTICELVIIRTRLNFSGYCDCENCALRKMLVEESQSSRVMMSKKYAHCPLKKRPVVREERPATPPTTPPHPAHLATTLYYDYNNCKYLFCFPIQLSII